MYAMAALETICAFIIDEHPKARLDPLLEVDEVAADAMTKVVNGQREQDERNAKVALATRKMGVFGNATGKLSWAYEQQPKIRRDFTTYPATGLPPLERAGQSDPFAAAPRQLVVTKNRPTLTIIPNEDSIWDPRAMTSVEEAGYWMYRTWWSKPQLELEQEAGRFRNVDKVKSGDGQSGGARDPRASLCEVVELWTRERLLVVADHRVVLRDEPNPYDHGMLPFIHGCLVPDMDGMPDLARGLEGVSLIRMLRDLQKARWRNLNTRLDNAEMVLSPVLLVDPEVDWDYRDVRVAPRAVWEIPGIGRQNQNAVRFLNAPASILGEAIANDETLAKDMAALIGAVDVTPPNTEQVNEQTATEVAIDNNIAQSRLRMMKNASDNFWRASLVQELELNLQYVFTPQNVRVPQALGGFRFATYQPADLCPHAGSFMCTLEETSESLDRQTRRQEALAMLAQSLQAAPVFASEGTPFTPRPAFDRLARAFDYLNPDEFFPEPGELEAQAAAPPQDGAAPLPGGAPPPMGPAGVAPGAATAATAPGQPPSAEAGLPRALPLLRGTMAGGA